MEFEDGIDIEAVSKRAHDFSKVGHGKSLWCRTNSERISMLQAFRRYEDRHHTGLQATSRAVGMDDPKGDGFRIWFLREPKALKPAVAARLPRWEALDYYQKERLAYTGIFDQDDMTAAIQSTDMTPTTVAEAAVISRMIHAWKTPFQLAFMEANGRQSQEQIQALEREKDRAFRERDAWPADDGRAVSPSYESLTPDQRRELKNEARIENADEYGKAMRQEQDRRPGTSQFYTVIRGFSDFTSWKVRQATGR